MPKCSVCKKNCEVLITVWDWKGKMKKVCRRCYYDMKEYS